MFHLADYWVWDSWIAEDAGTYHLFFLKAPRSLGDTSLRHERAVIGHATSVDLVDWTEHPDALVPSEAGWDDLALWTGSTVRGDDGTWRMYYTAIRRDGHGIFDQRIGFVESGDLCTWTRTTDCAAVQPDGRWYRTLDDDPTASETWRDPFVFRDEGGDGWHMLFAAREKNGTRNQDGVIGHAWSRDMGSWEVRSPLSNTAGFGQVEVAQVRVIDGIHVLVFTCHPDEQSTEWRERFGDYCTWWMTGDSAVGPWDLSTARPFTAEPDLFAAPLVRTPEGGWAFVGFLNHEPHAPTPFDLVDPIPVRLVNGELVG